jgi:D-3-phosphoglycerate dehydrogenase
VNAVAIAEERGIRIEETRSQRTQFADTILVTLQTGEQESSVEGMVLHGSHPRLLALNGINVESPLEGHLVVTQNQDVPGVIGQIGTILGKNNINIADFSLGREHAGSEKNNKPGKALAVVHIDEEVSAPALKQLAEIAAVTSVRAVNLN